MSELRLTSPFRYAIALFFGWWAVVMALGVLVALALAWDSLSDLAPVLLAVAVPLGAYTGYTLTKLRMLLATPAGLRAAGLRRRLVVHVPWTQVRSMSLRLGRNGALWIVDYDLPGAGPARVVAPAWAGRDGHTAPEAVEQVHALWSAAAGPVALRARRWRFDLERASGSQPRG